MSFHHPRLTATSKGIFIDDRLLVKSTANTLPYPLSGYVARAEQLLKQVKPEDWNDSSPHVASDVPLIAHIHMLLALAMPIHLEKYSPDQPRVPAGNSDGGQWTDGDGDFDPSANISEKEETINEANSPIAGDPQPYPKKAPASTLSFSKEGLNTLKNREKFVSEIYVDQSGYNTIGYGHKLLNGESFPNGMDEAQGEQILIQDISKAQTAVQQNVRVAITQSQFDALVSFTFNIGVTGFKTSNLLSLLNQGDFDGAAAEFPKWNKRSTSTGKVPSLGLTNRRREEQIMFLNGIYH